MNVRPYDKQDAERWDELCRRAPMATFLHTRRFLSYHGNRFNDASLILEDDSGKLLGVLPAAIDPLTPMQVISHPGITYGGLIHAGQLRGDRMLLALEKIAGFFANRGSERFRYKAVPSIYHRTPSDDDLYALFRLGAKRYRCDLSCAVDLGYRLPISERRRRSLKKATNSGVELHNGLKCAAVLWPLVEENLRRKHGVAPIHSLTEITLLGEIFPDNIKFFIATLDNKAVAGTVLFIAPTAFHAQYAAANEEGYNVCALDAVFEDCIKRAVDAGARYFDFGISTEQEGRYLNTGLYRFKSEFGGGGIVHEFFEVNLKP